MHRRGHVGLALLAWLPVAAELLSRDAPRLALLGTVVAVWFATLPDVDLSVPLRHRGPTHSLTFAFATAVVTGGGVRWGTRRFDWSDVAGAVPGPLAGLAPDPLAALLAERLPALLADVFLGPGATPETLGLVVGIAAGVSVASHVLGDALTPVGVELFWPISGGNVSVDLVTAANPLANYGFFACGSLAAIAVVLGADVVDVPTTLPLLGSLVLG